MVILADEKSETGLVIEVLDQARLAGVENVAVAATPDGMWVNSRRRNAWSYW